MSDTVSVEGGMAAPAERVWAMVSDLTRMGEWSPENEGAEWLGGATGPAPGAKFRGTNRSGKRTWKTKGTVVDAEPGRRFSFQIMAPPGIKVAEWSYTIEPTATGCHVTEAWVDQRPGFFKPIGQLATGVGERANHNREGMEQTL